MDMTQYLDMYLEESREHLHKINEGLLDLEEFPNNRTILDEIFRSAHTLKGMSATMGFNRVAELTHDLENVLHRLRSDKLNVSPEILNLLFKCVDSLAEMVNDLANGGTAGLPIGDLLADLKSWGDSSLAGAGPELEFELNDPPEEKQTVKDSTANVVTTVAFNEYEKNLIKQAIDQGYQCYHLVVKIDRRCVMKSARAFMVFKNMEEIGEIIKSIPAGKEIEEERFTTGFELIIISKEPRDVIRRKLVSITEVGEPEINLISGIFNYSQVVPDPEEGPAGFENPGRPVPKPRTSQTLRVETTRLDSLLNLVGELVINKGRLEQIGRANQTPELAEILEQMDRITDDLQNIVMKMRMVPIDNVFSRFPRMVRDLARELGKEADLVIEGRETELDRTVIDEIGDPLVHLLRNALDHGLEEHQVRIAAGKKEHGQVILAARHEGNNVVIEVADDGKGLDPELIGRKAVEKGLLPPEELEKLDESSISRLIMLPGFSTNDSITDISGRGVGLDAVKSKIEALGGNIYIESIPGAGAKFKIQLPLTLAIIQALLVLLEREVYAIPLSFIAETTSVLPDQISKIQDQEVILLRGEVLPLVRLQEVLQVPEAKFPKEEEINIVVVRKGDQRVGLIVDTLIGQQEIVIKPLGKLLGTIPVIAGATILGNGQVSLILDVTGLF